MAKVDLSKFTVKDLVEIQNELPAAISAKAKAEAADLRAKLSAIAAESGFLLEELFSGTKKTRGSKFGSAAVKYRNPENPAETWSGRGRMATWLKEKVAKRGVKIEDFAV